jgi:hypothetical protein
MPLYLNGLSVIEPDRFGTDLIPLTDDDLDVGSATLGIAELHIATDFLLSQLNATRLQLRNSADTAFQYLDIAGLYTRVGGISLASGAVIAPISDNIDYVINAANGTSSEEVARAKYGAGAGAARFELKQAKLTGTFEGNGHEIQKIKHIMRKATVTGVVPSATADTYGTATDILPTSGYYGLNPLVSVVITAGGTFGTETLTVRVTATFSDATTASITKDFTAVGSTALTNEEIEDLMADGVAITKLSVDCKSTIASSTATGGANVAALNT